MTNAVSDNLKVIIELALAAGGGVAAKLMANVVSRWKASEDDDEEQAKLDRKTREANRHTRAENEVSLEEIRNKGILELLNDYRKQVIDLRAIIMDQDNRFDALEAEHLKTMNELYTVRAELRVLQARMGPV